MSTIFCSTHRNRQPYPYAIFSRKKRVKSFIDKCSSRLLYSTFHLHWISITHCWKGKLKTHSFVCTASKLYILLTSFIFCCSNEFIKTNWHMWFCFRRKIHFRCCRHTFFVLNDAPTKFKATYEIYWPVRKSARAHMRICVRAIFVCCYYIL